jgi:hypothetical protein
LVAKADLAARARDATEIWLRVDDRFRQASTDRDYIPVARGVR